ncbi:PKD domain-containing protein [Candidatus Lokiarchaeum ossiferum]|uniref:PKD domain-containing protein n=1 Tax=Candidatus Lokiarchaeum ossiferum TaxID=2951803 RepID=UPI00352C9CE8
MIKRTKRFDVTILFFIYVIVGTGFITSTNNRILESLDFQDPIDSDNKNSINKGEIGITTKNPSSNEKYRILSEESDQVYTNVDPQDPLIYPGYKIPVVQFSIENEDLIADTEIQFTDETFSGNLPFQYIWNFGDGTSNNTQQHPSHIFSTPGNYLVSLIVIDFDGDWDSETQLITIRESIRQAIPLDYRDQNAARNISSYPLLGLFILGGTLVGISIALGGIKAKK